MAMSKNNLLLALIAFLGLVTPAVAQLHTECNPITSSKCPADPALGTTFQWDFRRGPNNAFATNNGWLPYIRYDSTNGATLKVNSSGIAPTLTSSFYIMFGRLEVVIKTASGTGIVSDIIFESDDQDEIDLEWVATQPNTVQSNYYSPRGRAPSYNQMKMLTTSSSMQASFRTYTVDWNADRLTWAVDGVVMRTVSSKNNDQYPQSPMKITIGLWAGGDSKNSAATINWAGGRTDYSKGPFEMSIKSIKVVDYSRGSSYSYGDRSGKYGSIKAANGAVRPHASRAANSATVSTYKVPASLVRSTKAATSTTDHRPTAPTQYPLPLSKNGQCGAAANSSTCAGSGFGNCCSQYGYCGSGPEYCGQGCLQYYGLCGSQTLSASATKASSAPTDLPVHGISPGGYCGVKNGSTTCLGSGFGECCSQYGACGNGKDWCGSGCQPSFGNCDGYPRKYPPGQLSSSSRLSAISSTTRTSVSVSKISSTINGPGTTTKVSSTAIKTSSTTVKASLVTTLTSFTSSKVSSTISNVSSAMPKGSSTAAQTTSTTTKSISPATPSSSAAPSSPALPYASSTTFKTSLVTPMESSTMIQESTAPSKLSSSSPQASSTSNSSPASSISPNGRCGKGNGNTTCANSGFGQCCSQYSYCGDSIDYCGAGCQSAFGNCNDNASQPPASTSVPTTAQPTGGSNAGVSPGGYCGPDNGSTTCTGSNFGRCCSQYGSCGNTDEYCGKGCQPLFGACNGGSTSSSELSPSVKSTGSGSIVAPSSSTRALTSSPPAYTSDASSSSSSSDGTSASTLAYGSPSKPISSSKASTSSAPASQIPAATTSTSMKYSITSSVPNSSPSGGAEEGGDNNGYNSTPSSILSTSTKTSSAVSVSVALGSSTSSSSSATPSNGPQSSSSKSVGLSTSGSIAASTSSPAAITSSSADSTSSPAASTSSPTTSAPPSTFTTLDCPHDNGTSYLSPNTTPNKVYKMYCSSDLPPGTIGWGGGADIFQCIKQCDAKAGCIAVTYAPWFGKGACYYRSNVTSIISRENATLAILQTSQATGSSRLRRFRRGLLF